MTTYDGVIATGSVAFAAGSTSSIPLPSGADCSTPSEAVVLSVVIVRAGIGVGATSFIGDMSFTGGFQPVGVDYAACAPFDFWSTEFEKHLSITVSRYMKVMFEAVAPGGTIEVPITGSDSGTLYYLVEQFRGLDGSLGTPSLTDGSRFSALAGSSVHGTPPPYFTGTTSAPYGGSYDGVVTVPASTGLATNIQIGDGYCTPGYRSGTCALVSYPNLIRTGTAFASSPFGFTGYDDGAFSIVNTLSGTDAPSGSSLVPGTFPWEVAVGHCLDPSPGTIPLGAAWDIGPYNEVLICGSHIDPVTHHVVFVVTPTPTSYPVLGVSFPYASGGGPPDCPTAPPRAGGVHVWKRF